MSKCRGAFDPKWSLKKLQRDSTDAAAGNEDGLHLIDIEESYCMAQCKRGPNMRVIHNGQVQIFQEGNIMTEVEMKRKTFQSVTSEERVARIWGLAESLVKGEAVGAVDGGSVESLTDVMPVV
jgi:(2Fe-2S) ferredoxin